MKTLLENEVGSFEEEKHDCYDNSSRICALVDQNGYIMASNLGPSFIGRFIGEQSNLIIEHLVNEGVLKEVMLEDTQASCAWTDHSRANAGILLLPARLIINGLLFLLKTLTHITVQIGMLIFSIFQSQGYASGGDNPDILISCTHRWEFYLFQRDEIEMFNKEGRNKEKRCSNDCKMKFGNIRVIKETNMFFLDISIPLNCHIQCKKMPKVLKRARTENEHYCVNETKTSTVETQTYRRRPSNCFNETKTNVGDTSNVKNTYACGRAGLITPSFIGLVLTLFVCLKTIV